MKTLSIAIASVIALSVGTAYAAQPSVAKPNTVTAGPKAHSSPRTERGRLAGSIVRKWADYVQQVHGTPPMAWSRGMRDTFAQADLGNLRKAAARRTYEGMVSALVGQKMTDAQVIDKLARSDGSMASVATLGSPSSDLVYTMIEPCRIVNTLSAGGALAAGSTRNFISHGATFAAQGGSATNCGIPADPSALAVNVAVVNPAVAGFLTLFPYNTPRPGTSNINYQAGVTLANGGILKMTLAQVADFSVFSQRTTHVVVDVVGYFMAPVATALDCILPGPITRSIAAGATGQWESYSCATGYKLTGGGCWVFSSLDAVDVVGTWPGGNTLTCNFANPTGAAANGHLYPTCCRMSGR